MFEEKELNEETEKTAQVPCEESELAGAEETGTENTEDFGAEKAEEAEDAGECVPGGPQAETDGEEGDAGEESFGEAPCDKPGKKERRLKWTERAKKDAEAAEEKAAEKTAALIAEANDRYTRLFAEFDNFRKRTEKEKSSMFDYGARSVIEKILSTVDNFERGLSSVPEEEKSSPFVEGMDKVYKQLTQTLADIGVTPIEAVGKEFDPNFHNAVMHVDDENAGENIVVEEFQKGYMYKDTVVRFSMVKVAN